MTSTNEQKYGAKIFPSYAFIAPNEAFDIPVRELTREVEVDGEITELSEIVSIRDYFRLTKGNRKIMTLGKGTHSFALFAMSEADNDFANNKHLMAINNVIDGGLDFTLDTADVGYILNYEELQKFLDESPLAKSIEPELSPE